MTFSRSKICLLALVMAACGGSGEPVSLPREFGGQWRLQASEPETDIPEVVKQLGMRSATRARYQGDGELTVRVFKMNGATSSFELVQKWRPQQGTMHFQHEDLFFVIEKQGAENAALAAWSRALDETLRKNQKKK